MRHTDEDLCIALAGVFQSAALVKAVARHGAAEPQAAWEATLASLFAFDPPSTEAVFGDLGGVHYGLNVLRQQLDPSSRARDLEITRYAVSLLHLEGRLRRRPAMLSTIRDELEATRAQVDYFSLTHGNVIARLADIYSRTVSTLGTRIMVNGEPQLLARQEKADQIRALLLGGIRAAILWHQVGGSRLKLLLGRRRLLAAAESLRRRAMA